MAEPIAFWSLAVVLVGSALAVVLSKNLFHSVLWLALALTGTAGVFLLLEAEFLAAVQLLLYAGGIVTIVVFAIVVTERLVGERITQTSRHLINGAIVSAAVFAGIAGFLLQAPLATTRPEQTADVTALMGRALVEPFAVTLQLLGVLLVAGLIGALYFARSEE